MNELRPTLHHRWMDIVERKGTVLCAGIDPSHLPFDSSSCEQKRAWALRYVEAVAPFCAAVKPNIQFWKAGNDMKTLEELYQCALSLDLLVIEDSKLADIGSTNDAGLRYASIHADAVTVAPYAGNLASTVASAKKIGLSVITLCLMSNPEYRLMKKKLVPLPDEASLTKTPLSPGTPVVRTERGTYIEQYLYRAYEARAFGAAGVVVGAPSPDNGITVEEMTAIAEELARETLVLSPGYGAQGGSLAESFAIFGPNRIIVNAGRALMYPQGPDSTPSDQSKAAESIGVELNRQRSGVNG